MKHAKDSKAWKMIDSSYLEFSSNPWNVWPSLLRDSFNPYGNLSSFIDVFDVNLVYPFNEYSWKQMLGNEIDVYFLPFIQEMRDLWDDGVETYDVSINKRC